MLDGGFVPPTLYLFQLGIRNDTEGQRPSVHSPTGGPFRQRQVIFQSLCQPRQQQSRRHGVSPGKQVEGHALTERADENIYLPSVLAAQVSQKSLAAARVAAQPRPVPGY